MGTRGDEHSVCVIVPAYNEAGRIGACLQSLAGQDLWESTKGACEIVVVANGCGDDTAEVSRGWVGKFRDRGVAFTVVETDRAGKTQALNLGDETTSASIRVYLDADVVMAPSLLGQLRAALEGEAPAYASGKHTLGDPQSYATRLYGRIWSRLAFAREPAVGLGLYAVNAAGRARWGAFPDLIADDLFVRGQFTPSERIEVPARFEWRLAEGVGALFVSRRRQEAGVRELKRRFPSIHAALCRNKSAVAAFGAAKSCPHGFALYSAITAVAKLASLWGSPRWR